MQKLQPKTIKPGATIQPEPHYQFNHWRIPDHPRWRSFPWHLLNDMTGYSVVYSPANVPTGTVARYRTNLTLSSRARANNLPPTDPKSQGNQYLGSNANRR